MAVGQVAACRELEPHDRVPGRQKRHVDGGVGR